MILLIAFALAAGCSVGGGGKEHERSKDEEAIEEIIDEFVEGWVEGTQESLENKVFVHISENYDYAGLDRDGYIEEALESIERRTAEISSYSVDHNIDVNGNTATDEFTTDYQIRKDADLDAPFEIMGEATGVRRATLEKDEDGQYPLTRISDIRVTEKRKFEAPPVSAGPRATHEEHKEGAPEGLKVAVVTVSTSRKVEDDRSGELIKEIVGEANHTVAAHAVVPDKKAKITEMVTMLMDEGADAVIVNGGTGLDPTDVTIEALQGLFTKEISAFGPLLAQLSFREVGTACVTSRATAGIVGDVPVFCIPGSPAACELAVRRLIVPELGHIVKHARRLY